jgi:hypothetical protein
VTLTFAVTAGIGFASINIADVTASRAAIVTPAVTMARDALSDAVQARDRECRGGVGRFCRQREEQVTSRENELTQAMAAVAQTADPHTVAAMRLIAWISAGKVTPSEADLAMLRLLLLALLPQIGGILIMVGRGGRHG